MAAERAVQLVYSSLGKARNERLFASLSVQDKTIAALVALAKKIGVDGIDVDVEQLGDDLVPAYGAFVGRLRVALRAAHARRPGLGRDERRADRRGDGPGRRRGRRGPDLPDGLRLPLRGLGRRRVRADGPARRGDRPISSGRSTCTRRSACRSSARSSGCRCTGCAGASPGRSSGAERLGDGAIWVPADNPKFLANPPAPPQLDPIEVVEFYAVAPTVSPVPGDSRATAGWQAIYVDSPADPDAQAGPRRRPRPRRRRVLGDRLRAGAARLHGPHRPVRGGQARLAQVVAGSACRQDHDLRVCTVGGEGEQAHRLILKGGTLGRARSVRTGRSSASPDGRHGRSATRPRTCRRGGPCPAWPRCRAAAGSAGAAG